MKANWMKGFFIFCLATKIVGCNAKQEVDVPLSDEKTAPDQTAAALQSSTALCDFAVYSKQYTNLRDRVTTVDGYIGSAGALEIGNDSLVTGDLESVGGITVWYRATVNGNLTTGSQVTRYSDSVVTGTIDENAPLTTFAIPFKPVSSGAQDVFVYSGQTRNLAPGNYDEIVAYGGSTLRLSAGIYQVRRFVIESASVNLKMNLSAGPIDVNVRNELRFGDHMIMALEGDSDAKKIRFYTNSIGQVTLGTDSIFYGTVTAPFGEIYAYSRMDIYGALYGKRVVVDTDIHFYGIGCEDPCAGVTCDAAPEDECLNTDTLRDYEDIGICDEGICDYSYTDVNCEYGCENGACKVSECDAGECCDGGFFKAAGEVCRAASGACDVAETCDGASAECPEDGFASSSVECRALAGDCDVAEMCTGSSAVCPADEFVSASTECRASAGECDVSETCTGLSSECPEDGFASASTECRASAGECDVTEMCSGTSAICPADEFASASTECRASAGECDVAEMCSGSSAACPIDEFASANTECRASAGDCDVAEMCSGSSATCPVDEVLLSPSAMAPVDGRSS